MLKACRTQEACAAADNGPLHLQLSFMLVAYPSLIITYLGQAAWLLAFPEQVRFHGSLALQLPCGFDRQGKPLVVPQSLQVSSTFYASIPFGDGEYRVMPALHSVRWWKAPLWGVVVVHASVLCCAVLREARPYAVQVSTGWSSFLQQLQPALPARP